MLSTTLLTVAAVVLGTSFIYFLQKLWTARIFFVQLKKLGLPMPEHNFAAGHLQTLASVVKLYPSDAIKVYLFGEISRKHSKGGACYLDLWPFAEPFLVITSPHLANQAASIPSLVSQKPPALHKWFWPITGGVSISDASGDDWKLMRSLFNRGFSPSQITTLVPAMVEETLVYCDILREKARTGDMFFMDSVNLRLMLDVIGRTGLNAKLGCQLGKNPLADALLNQISWKIANQEVNPLQWLNFVRSFVEWNNSRKMDSYINKEIDKRFEAYKTKAYEHGNDQFESIFDIVLQDYLAHPSRSTLTELDQGFRSFATRNMRLLLFVGHDSSGSTITYCYYLLSQNPACLARLRAEHDTVFGPDLSSAASAISTNPHILNQLPYTNAVIKEALRLFPPASSIRQGADGADLIDEDGNRYPTANCMVYTLHLVIQRDPASWVRAGEFLPERWLAGPDDPLYPNVKGAWRPFEHGARNCIGQMAVMLDVKVVLALTAREFDIRHAYEEFDKKHPRVGLTSVDGERAYQIDEGAAHPADHFPCRVLLRDAKQAPTFRGI